MIYSKTHRILFLEDVSTDREIAERLLKDNGISFVSECVETEEEFRQMLAEFDPTMILSDYMMPTFDGMRALKIALAERPDLPFIILTGSLNEDIAVECMKAGADDYVIKQNLKRLIPAVHSAIRRKELIAAQKESEIRLRESESKYRSLIENSNDAIYLLYNRRFEIINHKFIEMFEYSHEDVNQPGFDFIQLVSPKSKNIIEERVAQVGRGIKISPKYEFTAISKSGNEIEVEVSVSYLPYKKGTAVHGIIRDITDRKKAEKQLKIQALLRKLMIELSSEFINLPLNQLEPAINRALAKIGGFVDADRCYIFEYNFEKQILTNTYEWSRDGNHSHKNSLQDIPLNMIPEWVEAHKNGKTLFWEDIESITSSGVKKVLQPIGIKSILALPMMDNKECIGFVGFEYISKSHSYSESEWQILKIFAQMMVNIKIRKNFELELILSKEKAEKSEKLKTEFLSQMSHEIRTPINIILSYLSLLRDEYDIDNNDDIPVIFQSIDTASERIIRTIDLILNMSEIQAGSYESKPVKINLHELITSTIKEFLPQAGRKNLKFNYFENIPEAGILADKYSVNQILQNLIDNAVKYTNEGSISVSIDDAGDNISVSIKDTGIGISEEYIPSLFEPFSQEEQGYTRKFEGNGLGLALVKKYCDINNAEISVKSGKGKGTEFLVLFSKKSE